MDHQYRVDTRMDHQYRVDTRMEMMQPSPTCVSVSETSPSSPSSQGPSSPRSIKPKRTCKTTQKYNRNTVKMEDYLKRSAEKITAKEYRVLIPQMFQATQYPRREINRTKVKGLWDKSAQPHDWPIGISFRDPNNQPKYSLQESKKVFDYLRDKLITNDISPATQAAPIKAEKSALLVPKEEPLSPPSHTAKAVFPGPLHVLPDLPMFQDGHSQLPVVVSREPPSSQPQAARPPVMAVSPMMASESSKIPIPVRDMEEAAKAQGVVLKPVEDACTPQPPTQVTDTAMLPYDGGDVSLMSRPQAIKVEMSYEELQTANALTTLSNAVPLQQQTQVISIMQEEGDGQAIHVQSNDTIAQPSDSQTVSNTVTLIEDVECVEYARTIEDSLIPIIEKFGTKFENNEMVMLQLQTVLTDVYKPLYELAKTSKSTCAELSKLGSRLQEMLKRFTFFSGITRSEDIVNEMNTLMETFRFQEVVICPETMEIPQVAHEVCVMRAETDSQPTLRQDERDYYIPTISDLEQRAKQKEAELHQAPPTSALIGLDDGETPGKDCMEGWKDSDQKVVVQNVMSPVCLDLEQMNINEVPENFGIKLKEGCLDDEPESIKRESEVNFETVMNDLNFLNTAQTTSLEDMGISTRSPVDTQMSAVVGQQNTAVQGLRLDTQMSAVVGQQNTAVQGLRLDTQMSAVVGQQNTAVQVPRQDQVAPAGSESEETLENLAVDKMLAAAQAQLGDNPTLNFDDNDLINALGFDDDWLPCTNVTTSTTSLTESEMLLLNNFPELESDPIFMQIETEQFGQASLPQAGLALASPFKSPWAKPIVNEAPQTTCHLNQTTSTPNVSRQQATSTWATPTQAPPTPIMKQQATPTQAPPTPVMKQQATPTQAPPMTPQTLPSPAGRPKVPHSAQPTTTQPIGDSKLAPYSSLQTSSNDVALTEALVQRLQQMQTSTMIPTTVLEASRRVDDDEPVCKKSRRRYSASKPGPYKGSGKDMHHLDHGRGRYGKRV